MFLKLTYYINNLSPGGPIPHNMAKTSDGPPTLERSGSEHRVGRFPSSSLRVKTEMRGGAFFNGKEGRDDFRKLSIRLKEGRKGIQKKHFL